MNPDVDPGGPNRTDPDPSGITGTFTSFFNDKKIILYRRLKTVDFMVFLSISA